jgi:hypothetical protein
MLSCVIKLVQGYRQYTDKSCQDTETNQEHYDNNSPSRGFQEICISSSKHKPHVTYKIEGLQILQILDQRRVESTTWKKNLPPFKIMFMENDKPAITRFQIMEWIWFTIIIYLSILFTSGL